MLETRTAALVSVGNQCSRGVRRRRGLPLKAGAPSSHPTAAPFGTRHEEVVRARPARHDALNGVFWLPANFSSLCGRRRQAYCDCERHLPQEKWAGGRRTVCSSAGRRSRPQGQVLRPWRTGFERGRLPYFPRKAAQVATQRISRTHALRDDGYGTGRHLVASGHWSGVVRAYLEGDFGRVNTFYPAKSPPGPATFSRGR